MYGGFNVDLANFTGFLPVQEREVDVGILDVVGSDAVQALAKEHRQAAYAGRVSGAYLRALEGKDLG